MLFIILMLVASEDSLYSHLSVGLDLQVYQSALIEPKAIDAKICNMFRDDFSDDELVGAALDTENRAWATGELYKRYWKLVARIAGARNRPADVDEVCQDIWVIILNNLEKYTPNPNASFKSWLSRVAYNRITDLGRRKVRNPVKEGIEGNEPVAVEPVGADTELAEVLKDCLTALQGKNATQHCVVVNFSAGISYPEIAKTCGLEVSQAHRRKKSAIEFLEKCVKSKGGSI